jgi:hypothetical protein
MFLTLVTDVRVFVLARMVSASDVLRAARGGAMCSARVSRGMSVCWRAPAPNQVHAASAATPYRSVE